MEIRSNHLLFGETRTKTQTPRTIVSPVTIKGYKSLVGFGEDHALGALLVAHNAGSAFTCLRKGYAANGYTQITLDLLFASCLTTPVGDGKSPMNLRLFRILGCKKRIEIIRSINPDPVFLS
jgi:hypothetical protein